MRKDKLISEVLGQEHALSPSDLINAELRTVIIGGYDKIEVDALLERAADVLERFAEENRRLRMQLDEQREQVQQHQEMELTLRNAIISAHKAGETLIESARSQAEALIEEARLEKARARFQVEELPEAMRDEIRRLRDERARLRADIQAVLRAHESLLERLPRAEDRQQAALEEERRGHYIGFEDDHVDTPPPGAPAHAPQAVRQEEDGWETFRAEGGDRA